MSRRPPPPPPGSARRVPSTPEADERRQHVRYELLAQLQLKTGGDVSILNVGNVSEGGLLVALGLGERPAVRNGEEVTVFMDLGDDENGNPIDLDGVAKVVRTDLGDHQRPASIALQWVAEDPEFQEKSARFLAQVKKLAGE